MATIQIRDIPDDAYEKLRDAAKAEGKSLQSFMREQAIQTSKRVHKAAVLKTVRDALAENTGTGVTTESIIRDLDAIRGPWPDEE